MKFEILSISFPDAKIFKNQNGIPFTTMYKKSNDHRNFFKISLIKHTQNFYQTVYIQSSIT